MHDFLSYLFYLFERGLTLAVPAAALAAVPVALVWGMCRVRKRPFSWGRAAALVLLVGWAALTVFATLLRSEPTPSAQWSLQLFRAWREAWNRFTLQLWLNILLNIALFVPLGILLPLLGKALHRWYTALAAGFFASLAIELCQLVTRRGMFDADDLFTNTLGAMLGWSLTMLALTLRRRGERRRALSYAVLPLALALALGSIAAAYTLRPYGNLREASVGTADLKAVEWTLDFVPSSEAGTAQVYRTAALDKAAAERFAANFAAQRGVHFPDAYYYDDTVIFADHSTGDFLDLTLHDGTWEYSLGDAVAPAFASPVDGVGEAALRTALDALGLGVPAEAEYSFSMSEGGFGYADLTVTLLPRGDTFLSGTLTCCLQATGNGSTLTRIESGLASLTPVREEAILSPAEALARLRSGKSFDGSALAASGTQTVTVRSCELDYCSDTKGFYQPVYRFTLSLTDCPDAADPFIDYIPALR